MTSPAALGRLIQFDERSRNYPIRSLISEAKKPRSYTWRCHTYFNQGQTSTCVGHSWTHEIAARPVETVVDQSLAYQIYRRAQQIDEWPGAEPSYYGTSVLAGAKATQETGHIGEYRWAFGLDDLIMAVGYSGPVVVGTNWYESMFAPDSKGLMTIGGPSVGGHAYLINGISIKNNVFRIHNSWGRNWGKGGDAFISFDDMGRLLREQGEACVPVQRIRI